MAKKKQPPKEPDSIAHREYGVTDDHALWCRVVVNFDDRRDSVPAVNGIEVGQYWRNIHVGKVERVYEIRLAGSGTHTAHYESIVLTPDGVEPGGMFDISGWALWSICDHWEQVEQVEGEWQRVEPQPFVWENHGDAREQRASGTYRSEDAWVCRVRHDRPEGEPVRWKGQRRTQWALYENSVVTCDGLVLGSFKGLPADTIDELIVERYPLSTPGPSDPEIQEMLEGIDMAAVAKAFAGVA